MYTVGELERIVSDGSLQMRSDGTAHLALQLARQLLDTMRENAQLQSRITELETFGDAAMLVEHAQMKARIEAAAAIPAKPQESASDFEAIIYNECRAEFCKALGMGGE